MANNTHKRPGMKELIKRKLYFWRMALERSAMRTTSVLNIIGTILMITSSIGAVVCLAAMVVHAGYDHTPEAYAAIKALIRSMQILFIVNILFNLLLRTRATLRDSRVIKWIVDIAVLTTLIPLLFPHPAHSWMGWLHTFLYSNYYTYSVLIAYCIVTISFMLFKLVGRRTNPSLLLSGSFLVFILIGSFLLQLPKCTHSVLSYTDALFVSTSAVSITGLTPVDVATTFTPLGYTVIAILIQIGALGVMTFTSFFALFFSGSTSIYSQMMLKDMVYSKTMNALVPTLLYILGFTVVVELLGAVLIFLSIHSTLDMTLGQEIGFSVFHSISAFCNAGFSTIPDGFANPLLLDNNIPIYWVLTLLIVSGAIGYPILVNFRDAIAEKLRRALTRLRPGHRGQEGARTIHLFNLNTKIVLVTFSILFVAAAVLFFIIEYDNSLAGMTMGEKITQSVFNSAVPRSAGFSSVNPAEFMPSTLIMVMLLMWVGGASQSTAGGIKVNTLAAIWLNLRAIVTGAPKVTAFSRQISIGSIRRANAVVAISILSYFALSFTLLLLEPTLPVRDLLFESLSALFTVGSSLGVTADLGTTAKIVVCVAMFVGRVGLVSLLTGLVRHNQLHGAAFPSDIIIIN
ncbi:MAG: potassium transporter [Paramuribaculum sp.]|nr:potassium transporter [Paramuribaculum sp.]